jgi:tRNA A37 threonylcarbamoyladenosine dehydratase
MSKSNVKQKGVMTANQFQQLNASKLLYGSSSMMLKDKVAVIYGAAGAVGSIAAHAFAREGASVFSLVGQHQNSIKSQRKFLLPV